MALLTTEKRKEYFKYLGLGAYNKANVEKFQRKAFIRKSDIDGVYGTDTDRALRHFRNVKKYAPNFKPQEFKCECGGKYCTGYPSWMKKVELQNLQAIRDHYGKPMTVTCGLRCKTYNSKLAGSIQNSKHLTGYACDFYMKGVTDTLANRKKAIKWIKKLPNHHYTYGDGYNSNGVNIRAAYMGNALHTDTNKAPKKKAEPVLTDLQKSILVACEKQAKCQKNAKYDWEPDPTPTKSKKKATCVTFEGCSYQRADVLPEGKYLWHDTNGKVTHARKNLRIIYPDKKLKNLKKVIEAGDAVMVGNKHDVGAGSHVFIATGEWQGDYPIVWDHKSAYRYRDGKKTGEHVYKDHEMCFAIVHPLKAR